MRYNIQIKSHKNLWVNNSDVLRCVNFTNSDDESKIMKSFVDFCNENPLVVARHGIRIFDNNLYDWVLRTEVPDGFKPYIDSICILWNYNLPENHPLIEFSE